jgi:hypothetical protein
MAYSGSSLTPSRPAPSPSMYSSQSTLVSSQSALASNGYGPAFTFNPSSPSGSSYATSYSGIGGSPSSSNGAGMGGVVRQGPVSVKEDGTFASWIWKVKWLVLKEMTLTLHKSEVRSSVLSMGALSSHQWQSIQPLPESRGRHLAARVLLGHPVSGVNPTCRAPHNNLSSSSATSPTSSGQTSNPTVSCSRHRTGNATFYLSRTMKSCMVRRYPNVSQIGRSLRSRLARRCLLAFTTHGREQSHQFRAQGARRF